MLYSFLNFLIYIIVLIIALIIYLKSSYGKYSDLILFLTNINNNEKNMFMNFGYWDENTKTLEEANNNLCNKFLDHLEEKKKILDVGCGYGYQDNYFTKNKKYDITAIDIDEGQIKYANYHKKSESVKYETGDATRLNFDDKSFDIITNIESGFHYNTREKFFKEANRVLKKGGKLITCDILLNNKRSSFSYPFYKAFQYFFSVCDENMIDNIEWQKQLRDAGFSIKYYDITDNVYIPYFKYYVDEYNFGNFNSRIFKVLVSYIIDLIVIPFNNLNTFNYSLAVCTKI